MSVSEFVGFLIPTFIALAWLVLEATLYGTLSKIEKHTSTIDAENSDDPGS